MDYSQNLSIKNNFTCIASGSTGNCYLVNLGGGVIILDLGVSIYEITKNVNLNDVIFAYVSHEHKDHSKSMEEIKKREIKVFYGGDNEKILKQSYKGYKLYQVPIQHGECINNALIIQYENECVLYATDFNICKYNLNQFKFTQVIVECNFIESQLPNENRLDFKTKRQINTHMGLDGLKRFLNTLDLSECKEIDLIHMSQGYGNSIVMGCVISQKYKIRTGVCEQWGGVKYYGRG